MKQERMKPLEERYTRRLLTNEFERLLDEATLSARLRWRSTTADLMEAAHIAYEFGVEDTTGCLYPFTRLARRACIVLKVPQPPHPRRTAWQAARRKGVRQQTLLERFRQTLSLTPFVEQLEPQTILFNNLSQNPTSIMTNQTDNATTTMLPADSTPLMLSEHFSLHELTHSGIAIRHRIDNQPPAEAVDNLRQLCRHVLEPLRRRFGRIIISSAYRSPQLNLAVGGNETSPHLLGLAADIHVSDDEQAQRMFDFLSRHTDADQLYFEHAMRNGCRWLHVGYAPQTRQ